MFRHIALRLTLALVAILAMAAPASAGGWAVVHLDATPENVAIEVPVRIGFTVLQHDITPFDIDEFGPDASVTLEAQHRETAEIYREDAVQEGAVGHYVVEATFPRAGDWKWSIVPAPFAGTSFETLTVLDAPAATSSGATARPARITAGTCAARGKTVHILTNPADDDPAGTAPSADAAGVVGSPDALPVAIGETTLDVTIAELLASPHAVSVDDGAAAVACGDIGGRMWDGALVVGLQAVGATGEAGIATLREDGGRTTITHYLIPAGPETEAAEAVSADAVSITITDVGFSPSQVSVAAGTTVTWTNAGAITHTVTGDDLAFSDSGPLAPGDTVAQTFDTPGTFTYRCGPHPNMTGTITVS